MIVWNGKLKAHSKMKRYDQAIYVVVDAKMDSDL